MSWQDWEVQGRVNGLDLPKLVIHAEFCHDAQREYAELVERPEEAIEWIQHEPRDGYPA